MCKRAGGEIVELWYNEDNKSKTIRKTFAFVTKLLNEP